MIRGIRPTLFAAAAAVSMLVASPALAGPPLLCFPFDIGVAKSLPMGKGNWHAIDRSYDVQTPDRRDLRHRRIWSGDESAHAAKRRGDGSRGEPDRGRIQIRK
jgi:hypothetical protein